MHNFEHIKVNCLPLLESNDDIFFINSKKYKTKKKIYCKICNVLYICKYSHQKSKNI